jgi:hypothetical protein
MKRYVVIVLGVAAAIALCSVALSLALDPYRIVHPLLGEFVFEPNSRVSKLNFLAHACAHYDAYFVGDSRSATLSDRDLPRVSGRRFYNFSTPADNITSIDRRIRFLLERGCPISTLIAEESIDVLLDTDEASRYSLLLSEHPLVSGENRAAFYSRYFLSAQSLSTYFSARRRDPLTHDIYFPDGHADYLWAMQDGSPFRLPRCGAPKFSASERKLLPEKLSGYRELASLSKRYRFTAVVWIAPLNKWESGVLADPDIAEFITQLRAIPGLTIIEPDWDSPMLSDFREWHDCGHFRRTLFDQLLAPAISKVLADRRS